jgi:DegV family protein with EDD domain
MIEIVTDSTSDIPEDLLKKYGIIIIPQVVIWGEQQLRDGIDLQSLEFYQRLAKDPVRPHSSQPAVGDIQNALKEANSRGAAQIIVLTVSSAMSGSYGLVHNTAQEMNIPVSMVDSKGPSMSLGWQVLAAARARNNGADLASVLEQVTRVREKLA